jgi:hypothetical protein
LRQTDLFCVVVVASADGQPGFDRDVVVGSQPMIAKTISSYDSVQLSPERVIKPFAPSTSRHDAKIAFDESVSIHAENADTLLLHRSTRYCVTRAARRIHDLIGAKR